MSIGSYSVVLRSLVKDWVRATYCLRGSQVQQSLSTPALVLVVGMLAMSLISVDAHAGTLSGTTQGRRGDFYDWEFAKKVWYEMGTWEAEEKEWAKYSADFDPWLVEWKKNNKNAKKLLAGYSPEKRKNIECAYDIQKAWDTWYDDFYRPYIRHYNDVVTYSPYLDRVKELKSFDQSRAERNKLNPVSPCTPQEYLHQCGAWPDWRSPEMKAEERKLEELRAGRLKGH